MGTVLCNFYYNPAITGTGEKKLSRSRDPLAYFLNKLSTHTEREREGERQEREERREGGREREVSFFDYQEVTEGGAFSDKQRTNKQRMDVGRLVQRAVCRYNTLLRERLPLGTRAKLRQRVPFPHSLLGLVSHCTEGEKGRD